MIERLNLNKGQDSDLCFLEAEEGFNKLFFPSLVKYIDKAVGSCGRCRYKEELND